MRRQSSQSVVLYQQQARKTKDRLISWRCCSSPLKGRLLSQIRVLEVNQIKWPWYLLLFVWFLLLYLSPILYLTIYLDLAPLFLSILLFFSALSSNSQFSPSKLLQSISSDSDSNYQHQNLIIITIIITLFFIFIHFHSNLRPAIQITARFHSHWTCSVISAHLEQLLQLCISIHFHHRGRIEWCSCICCTGIRRLRDCIWKYI